MSIRSHIANVRSHTRQHVANVRAQKRQHLVGGIAASGARFTSAEPGQRVLHARERPREPLPCTTARPGGADADVWAQAVTGGRPRL
jgi:hypothetical protein